MAGGGKFTQDNRLLRIDTPLGPDTLLLDALSGEERVSDSFNFDLRVFSEQADLPLKALVGQPVSVELGTFDGAPRYFHGVAASFAHTGSDGGFAFYRIRLRPWMEFLRRRVHCRVFQNMKAEDIIKAVFKDYGPVADFDLRATSRKLLTLCIQYHESDFAFVSRLMEARGWHYYYLFGPGGHTLVIDDDSLASPPMPIQSSIEFNDSPGSMAHDAIDTFGSERVVVADKVAVKTFDFKNPKDPLLVKVDAHRQLGDLPPMEFYEHEGHYTYKEYEEGEDLANLRMEEAEARAKLFHGGGNCRAITCGHVFDLENHYRYKGDTSFLVLSVAHDASNNYFDRTQREVYRNTFTCMRKSVPYRPALSTPRPVMRGPQTATVVGPPGEEIYCDEYGRIRIQFHWDRDGQFDDQSLCWVRVAMPWAGSNFGFMTLPRIGQEVVVDFLEGDPDRPLVVGSVYNQLNMPPWDLPDNKTQSGILTRSSKDGTAANANALRFEDKKGQEEVWLHAEKNQRIEVENDESHSVGHDRTKTIGHDETTKVQHDRTETVLNNEKITIGVNRTETVGVNESLTIGAARDITVGANETRTVGACQTNTVALQRTDTIGVNYTLAVGGAMELGVGGAVALSVGGGLATTVGGDSEESVGANKKVSVDSGFAISAGKEVNITVGAAAVKIASSGKVEISGTDITLSAGGGKININTAGMITIQGSMVDIKGAMVKINS